MEIDLRLSVDEDEDVDVSDDTGLTSDAFDRLIEAISGLGYSFVSGPTRVAGE